MAEKHTPLVLETAQEARRRTLTNWGITIAVLAALAFKYPVMMKGALIFIITLSILVFVHEWGHYQFGRWAGMKINRFGIGFPPWIYTRRRNGIDYSIGALPIGGMVDIAGLGSEEEMVATARASSEMGTAGTNVENLDAGGTRREVELTSYMERNPDAPHGSKNFQDASLGWRFMTLFAGPLMNFIFALVIFITLFSVWGAVKEMDTKQSIGFVHPNTPADKAGLGIGDKIVSINGQAVSDTGTISALVQDSNRLFAQAPVTARTNGLEAGIDSRADLGARPMAKLNFGIERQGQTLTKTITPSVQDIPFPTPDGRIDSRQAPAIGIEFDLNYIREKVSVGEAVNRGVMGSLGMTGQILSFLGRAFTFNLSREEVKSIGGPVKIAQATTKSARGGFYAACLTAAMISVNLGLMNLLPLPALDGGRILFLGYELVFRKPLDSKKESLFHMAGMALLLLFMVGITIKDVWPWVIRSFNNVF